MCFRKDPHTSLCVAIYTGTATLPLPRSTVSVWLLVGRCPRASSHLQLIHTILPNRLLILLPSFHVPVLDVLPLPLRCCVSFSAPAQARCRVEHTPWLILFQIADEPVSKALLQLLAIPPSLPHRSRCMAHSSDAKAPAKITPRKTPLLRMRVLLSFG